MLISTMNVLIANTAAVQAELLEAAAAPASTWYAVLIATFAVLVGIGLVNSHRDGPQDAHRAERQADAPKHGGPADQPTAQRRKTDTH